MIYYFTNSTKSINTANTTKHEPFIVAFRAYLQLITIVAILAVDFNVFPRRFAKCEISGTSLMDVGVGAFIYSSGLVAGPRLKNTNNLLKTLKLVVPTLALGGLRIFLTRAVDYQEHVSEYGVHWNFFISLGLLPLLITFHMYVFKRVPLWIAYVFVLSSNYFLRLGYQYALACGLEHYILHAPRIDLISMNREGIFSLVGTACLNRFLWNILVCC
jgi:phosphatidylinositol glycan class W